MKHNTSNTTEKQKRNNQFTVKFGESTEEQLTAKTYYENRTLKLVEQFSPEEKKFESQLLKAIFAHVATGLFVSFDVPRIVC